MSTRTLESYAPIVGEEEIYEIRQLGSYLEGATLQNVNSTKVGGGVAEILQRLIPLLNEVGIQAQWDVLEGTQEFFDVTKAFHNALHGQDVEITPEMLKIHEIVNEQNYDLINPDSDFVVIHDPQPLGLVEIKSHLKGKWIWRCHIDLSEADIYLWGKLRTYVEKMDAAVFHLPQYSKGLFIDQYIIPPAIDPLSEKNRELTEEEINEVLDRFNIDRSRPYLIQVSRFDRLKDPVGVIKAFEIIRHSYDCQLVLAGGGAADDPEGALVLEEVMENSKNNPDIIILDLPPTSHKEINALQRGATVIIQKSIREGFGLVVTEAMWKGKPVVGGAVGGIRSQLLQGQTGFLAHSVEGTAFRARKILGNPNLGKRLGDSAKEYVRSNFLLPSLLKHWILLLLSTRHKKRGVIFMHDVVEKTSPDSNDTAAETVTENENSKEKN